MYENQLAIEAALMDLVLRVVHCGSNDVGENMRSAMGLIGENAGHINHGLAKLALQNCGNA